MVAEELRLGLYITIPLYFVMLGCVAFWAYRKNQKMKKEGVNDALSAHYLGGRSFGPFIMAGTMFASLFSGYTVVGVPNEAFFTGWFSLRWMASGVSLLFGLWAPDSGCERLLLFAIINRRWISSRIDTNRKFYDTQFFSCKLFRQSFILPCKFWQSRYVFSIACGRLGCYTVVDSLFAHAHTNRVQ